MKNIPGRNSPTRIKVTLVGCFRFEYLCYNAPGIIVLKPTPVVVWRFLIYEDALQPPIRSSVIKDRSVAWQWVELCVSTRLLAKARTKMQLWR